MTPLVMEAQEKKRKNYKDDEVDEGSPKRHKTDQEEDPIPEPTRRGDKDKSSNSKRSKVDRNPADNPYLAHHYPPMGLPQENEDYGSASPLSKFVRHKTTAAQALEVEDGKYNPFSGNYFGNRYLSILKGRRDLPVAAQR